MDGDEASANVTVKPTADLLGSHVDPSGVGFKVFRRYDDQLNREDERHAELTRPILQLGTHNDVEEHKFTTWHVPEKVVKKDEVTKSQLGRQIGAVPLLGGAPSQPSQGGRVALPALPALPGKSLRVAGTIGPDGEILQSGPSDDSDDILGGLFVGGDRTAPGIEPVPSDWQNRLGGDGEPMPSEQARFSAAQFAPEDGFSEIAPPAARLSPKPTESERAEFREQTQEIARQLSKDVGYRPSPQDLQNFGAEGQQGRTVTRPSPVRMTGGSGGASPGGKKIIAGRTFFPEPKLALKAFAGVCEPTADVTGRIELFATIALDALIMHEEGLETVGGAQVRENQSFRDIGGRK